MPGEMFARFTPEPGDSAGEVAARQAIALVKLLDCQPAGTKAPLFTIFRLYCLEGLTAGQVARRCGCGRSLVFCRLKLLRQKLGCNPAVLRQYALEFEGTPDSLTEARVRRRCC